MKPGPSDAPVMHLVGYLAVDKFSNIGKHGGKSITKWWTRGELKPALGFLSSLTKSHLSVTYRCFSSHLALLTICPITPLFSPGDAPVMQWRCV